MRRSGFKPRKLVSQGNGRLQAEKRPAGRQKRKNWHSIKRDNADIWFSKYIRLKAKWTCEACLKYLGENGGEASHFHGRRKESVRFDPDNVSCQCHSCHRRFTEQPEEHRTWKLKQLGQARFDRLTVRANLYCRKDRKLQAIIAKKLYEDEKARYEAIV